jgi:glutaminyl-tRNA synthetase
MNDTPTGAPTPTPTPSLHFIRQIIADDLKSGKYGGRVCTRFPPEPNGYLHIGHAKAICLDFGMALENGGNCHLRMDDTNPVKEEVEYIEAIQEDVRWLGFDWGSHFYFASDYFGRMYACAEQLIRLGKAYVCELSSEEWKDYRGVPTRPGKESPGRARTVEENLDLFGRMRKGEFPDGSKVLRARIDMASPNIHMRDPVLYRILHASHPHTGDAWCLYPTYDFAHCLEDSFESITHSICTLEFEVHRPLYDWILDTLNLYRPQQIEFARLNLSYTVMSKRKLLDLVKEGRVKGWDDPRMPTIGGLRRRGYTPEAIRAFCETIGVTKFNSLTDVALLEHCLREDLNKRAVRVLGVVKPLKLVIDNYPEGDGETFEAVNNPEDPAAGSRRIPFSRELYIEQDDFMENPPKKYFRLAPGQEVRLRYACLVRCTRVVKNAAGEVVEVHADWDPQSRGGSAPDGRKVKGTIHWVSAKHAVAAELRLYDRLFTLENLADMPEDKDFRDYLNPAALTSVKGWVEPSVAGAAPGARFQFERVGYFTVDPDSRPGAMVFNRTVTLKDSSAKPTGPAA